MSKLPNKISTAEYREFIKTGEFKDIASPAARKRKVIELKPLDFELSDNEIYLPGEVYSSKNSKQIWMKSVKANKTYWSYKNKPVLPFITDSNAVKRYKKECAIHYAKNAQKFIKLIKNKSYPIDVEFLFLRATKRIWDFNNMSQVVQDMMKSHGWIEDDCSDVLLVYPPRKPKTYIISKFSPGVIIKVL